VAVMTVGRALPATAPDFVPATWLGLFQQKFVDSSTLRRGAWLSGKESHANALDSKIARFFRASFVSLAIDTKMPDYLFVALPDPDVVEVNGLKAELKCW